MIFRLIVPFANRLANLQIGKIGKIDRLVGECINTSVPVTADFLRDFRPLKMASEFCEIMIDFSTIRIA